MARQHFFYNIIRKTTLMFLQVFQDIVIARYNLATGNIVKYVRVPIRFAPKTKQWYWTELKNNKDRRDNVLPMVAVSLQSVEFAQDRQVNRNARITFSNDGTTVKQHFNPVPYDLSFQMEIVAEYMVDITQIIEQVLPFFTPELYIRISVPELKIEGLADDGAPGSDKLDLKVIYEGSTTDIPLELDEISFRLLKWTLNFKVQGYLFSPIFNAKAIHDVVNDTYDFNRQSEAAEDIANGQLISQVGRTMYQGVTTATAIPTIGGPSAITIYNAGTGYSIGHEISTFGGNGSGLTLNITSVDSITGAITGIAIHTAGTGYEANNIVSVVDGNEDALIQITTVITDQIDDSIRAMYKYEHYE